MLAAVAALGDKIAVTEHEVAGQPSQDQGCEAAQMLSIGDRCGSAHVLGTGDQCNNPEFDFDLLNHRPKCAKVGPTRRSRRGKRSGSRPDSIALSVDTDEQPSV